MRVNGVRTAWIDDDLKWVASVSDHVDAVVVPKAESEQDVERVAAAAPSRRVIPLLETARGIVSAAAIAGANAEISALFFGAEDLTAELGIPRTLAGDEILLARSQVVLAAATIGAEAVDAVFVDFRAHDRLRQDAVRARALGFRGKMAIHPDQVEISMTSSLRRPTRSPKRSGCSRPTPPRARGARAPIGSTPRWWTRP